MKKHLFESPRHRVSDVHSYVDRFLCVSVVDLHLEAWISQEQAHIVQSGLSAPAPLDAGTKFYISFDGTGVPVRKNELVGRPGKQVDGTARTREAKLGCVFTQIGLDKEGRPQREPDSTTYVGAIESSTLFGWRMYAEALRRGLAQAKTVIVLADGQRYNYTIAQTHFPEAVPIVDLFHAFEHLTLIARIFWGPQAEAPQGWRDLLEAGDISRLVRHAGKRLPSSAKSRKSLRKELGYFEKNAHACVMPSIGKRSSSSVPASSRQAAAPSLVSASNSLACIGRCAEPTPLSPCAAVLCRAASKIFGPRAPASSHFYLVHPIA